ncbi:hypothetical protein D3C78_1379100 [compost metagenome]
MTGIERPADGGLHQGVGIGATQPELGLQHLTLGLLRGGFQQRLQQLVDQARTGAGQGRFGHLEMEQGSRAQGAGIDLPGVALDEAHQPVVAGKALAAAKHQVFEKMRQARVGRRLIMAAAVQFQRQGRLQTIRGVQPEQLEPRAELLAMQLLPGRQHADTPVSVA